MSKIILNNVGSLIEATTAANTINLNNNTIQTAMDNTLSRDGTHPNQMESSLDMNSNSIINVPNPSRAGDAVNYQTLSTVAGGGTVSNLPAGGSTGDVLAKNSSTDYDVHWVAESSDLLAGNNIVISGTSPATISTTLNPTFTTVNTATIPAVVDTLVGRNTTDTLSNKTLVAPALGTPVSGVATNLTGTASALTAGHVTTNANLTGDVTSVGNASTLATVNSNVGVFGSATQSSQVTVNGKGLVTGAINVTVTPSVASITGLGTGVGTALAVNVGTAGSPIVNGGVLGTPTSGVATNLTGTASGLTSGNVTTNANLIGDVTSVGNATTLTNAPVIAKVLTGYISTPGTVSPTDSILSAINKLNGNDATNANLTGDVTSVGNATTLTNAPVIAKVLTGYTSGAGTVSASDSILSAIQKLNGNDATNANLTGDVTSVGNATTLAAGNAGNLNSGTLLAARMPAHTGDVTTSVGTVATTIANNAVTNAKSAQMTAATLKGNSTASTANASDFTIQGLTDISAPSITLDWMPIYDHVAGTIKKVNASELVTAVSPGVTSIAGNTGAFTLSNGVTNSTNDIRLATIATGKMLANTTGSTAVPTATNLPVLNQSVFTAGGTFTTPSNSTTATVYKYRCVGAGGGGGGVLSAVGSGGGGGGPGAYSEGTFTSVAASTGITITIGAAGTAGASSGTNGGTGGTSSIGTPVNVSCTGGIGGTGTSSTTTYCAGGAGGTASGGTINMSGGNGFNSNGSTTGFGGSGGSTAFGGFGVGGQANVIGAGSPGAGYGAGGGGAFQTASGGAGAAGIIIIEWIL